MNAQFSCKYPCDPACEKTCQNNVWYDNSALVISGFLEANEILRALTLLDGTIPHHKKPIVKYETRICFIFPTNIVFLLPQILLSGC
jgi:hypothetical protein